MAKTEGDQSIPSELLDAYRATLGEQRPALSIQKRYPYRLPNMQEGKSGETAAQRVQRTRFKTARDDFDKISSADRQRWYAAAPPWSSFLWYYNYFIMSSLMGNANIEQGGVGVVKSIQFKTISMPAGSGEGQVAITAVDINKTVVMLFGNSSWIVETEAYAIVGTVYPYFSSLASELVKCKWSIASYQGENTLAATISLIVIEYI